MKEIAIKPKEEIRIVDQAEVNKLKAFLGTQILRPGHRCFDIDTTTGEVTEAKIISEAIVLPDKSIGTSRRVIVPEGHVCFNALNKQNAIKKYRNAYNNLLKALEYEKDLPEAQ
jgi:hypothetical protein